MNENILKYKVQKKKLNSNNAKDVAFQDMVILSNEVKFLEVSESVRGTNENILTEVLIGNTFNKINNNCIEEDDFLINTAG